MYSPVVDKVEMFKSKKLPVEFLSDNKLVFQEYSHLRTIKVSITFMAIIFADKFFFLQINNCVPKIISGESKI